MTPKILCTFPGRNGDLLWALPTLRAISRRIAAPVDLQIAGEFAAIVPLLEQQPYLGEVTADPRWSLTPPDDWRAPRYPLAAHDTVIDLGYRGWPQRPLPFEVLDNFNLNGQTQRSVWPQIGGLTDADLDLGTPWITLTQPCPRWPNDLAIGFTEAWFELKWGVTSLLKRGGRLDHYLVVYLTVEGSRWVTEAQIHQTASVTFDWLDHARTINSVSLFLGDCSALHVLAVALGVPALLVEPMEGRWNPIFYPLGMAGPQVTVVTGNDGRPTFDARAVGEALTRARARLQENRP